MSDRLARARIALSALLLAAATFVAYASAVGGGFIWDDDTYITANETIRSVEALRFAWLPGVTPQYYPLVFTTFAIEYHLWGLDPTGYHVTNVVLHILNALLIWRLCVRLSIPAGYAIAFVFALHPIHVESVAWVTERKNVLSMACYLIGALLYLRFDRAWWHRTAPLHRVRVWATYTAAVLAFVAALLSKTVTATLPVAIALMLLWRRETLSIPRLLPLLPMLALGFTAGLHTAFLERVRVGAVGPEFDHGLLERFLIASQSFLFYPWKLAVPWPLVFTYPRWEVDPARLVFWAAPIACLAIAFATIQLWRKGWRGVPLALVFYAVTIFPALGFANVYPMRFSYVADHFVYHASLGLIAAAVSSASLLLRGQLAQRSLFAAVLVTYAVLTFNQGRIYADDETLWRATLAKNPNAWMAHNNLAVIALANRDPGRAERHARAASELQPALPPPRVNLAAALESQGRIDEAAAQLKTAAALLDDLIEWHERAGNTRQVDELWSQKWAVGAERARVLENAAAR